MTDNVYGELPRELTALLRDPSIVLPGELEAFDRVHTWTVAPTIGNASTVISLPRGNYIHGVSPQTATGDTVPS